MTSQDPMFSAEDTPANHSVTLAKGKAKKTRDTSSPGSPKPFASYDPATQSWKTYPDISLWDSEPYKASWPRSGMSLDGIAYQLPPSAPRTSATESSLSQHGTMLWTPTAKANQTAPSSLKRQRLFPAPDANEGNRGVNPRSGLRKNGPHLVDVLNGRPNPMWVEWLMGFPIGWTDLEDSETPSSHKSPNTSEES